VSHTEGELDAPRVRDFLSARLGGSIEDVERVGHGAWSKAFGFRHAGAAFVARFSALDEDFRKDQRVMRFASGDLRVPRIVEIGPAFGGSYAISERVPGGFIDTLDAAGLRRVLPSLFRALGTMRMADLSDSHGFGGFGSDGNAPHATWREALLSIAVDRPTNRTSGWRPLLATQAFAARAFDQVYGELQRHVDRLPNERYLVHSDLLNFNVLVDRERVSGLIDWGSALYGDFVWDIAWFTFWQPWYPAWRDVDFAQLAQAHYASIGLTVPRFGERLRCCELAIGLDGMAYQAFTRRWSDLDATARRTLAVCERRPQRQPD
jgi:hygromycin-B 4-O-kinase